MDRFPRELARLARVIRLTCRGARARILERDRRAGVTTCSPGPQCLSLEILFLQPPSDETIGAEFPPPRTPDRVLV
jgi:hypothetical protein